MNRDRGGTAKKHFPVILKVLIKLSSCLLPLLGGYRPDAPMQPPPTQLTCSKKKVDERAEVGPLIWVKTEIQETCPNLETGKGAENGGAFGHPELSPKGRRSSGLVGQNSTEFPELKRQNIADAESLSDPNPRKTIG